MFKSILIICLSVLLISCGDSDEASTGESNAKYSLVMVESGEKLESNNLDYMGSGSTMTFGVGEKGELKIQEMYSELSGAELSSFEGKTYPGSIVFNDNNYEGEVLIEKVEEQKSDGEINNNKNFKIIGTFTADAGDKIKFGVSLFRMN